MREHAEGLICMSACIGGEVPHLIQREGLAAAEKVAREFMDIFGDDYYLEIQRHDIDPEAKVNDGLLKLHRKLGVPLVATNDFHFLRATDHDAHDALICIQTNKTVDEKNRMCYPDGLYMKSPAEMANAVCGFARRAGADLSKLPTSATSSSISGKPICRIFRFQPATLPATTI